MRTINRNRLRLAVLPVIACMLAVLAGCSMTEPVNDGIRGANSLLEKIGVEGIPLQQEEADASIDIQPLPEDTVFRFYRSALNEEEFETYELLRAVIAARMDSVELTTLDVNRLLELVTYVRYDNPEYFWFTEGCTVTGYERRGTYYVTLKFGYSCTDAMREKYQEEIDAVTGSVIERLSDKTDYEKVKGVYDFIVNNSVYDENFQDQSCYTLLVKRAGVCAGYTAAVNYMLNRLGMQTIYVPGSGRGVDHCWSLVKVNGSWYHLDVTWGDPVTEDGSQILTYTYFLATDKEMKRDHTVDENIPRLPECRSTGCNYYVWQGRYLDSLDYDYISKMLCDAASRREVLEFKCSNSKIFEGLCDYLFNRDGMWTAASFAYRHFPTFDEYRLAYSMDELHNIIRISPAYFPEE